ncbi:hypothetical protein ACFQ3Z_15645 [Streptomyces nogalater]
MSSEPAGSPDPVVRLADVLAQVSHGVRPTPLELAEVLWLARHMRPEPGTTGPEADAAGPEADAAGQETGTAGQETGTTGPESGTTGPESGTTGPEAGARTPPPPRPPSRRPRTSRRRNPPGCPCTCPPGGPPRRRPGRTPRSWPRRPRCCATGSPCTARCARWPAAPTRPWAGSWTSGRPPTASPGWAPTPRGGCRCCAPPGSAGCG